MHASTGSIVVPLNFWHRAGEHEYTIANCDPSLLFVEDGLRPTLGAVPARTRVLTMPVGEGDRADWEAFVAAGAGADRLPSPEVEETDAHMILYTSGTTGRPKGAMLSHRRTVDDAMAMAVALQPRSSDCFINYFPPFHVGNWDHMKLFFVLGGRVIFMRQFDAGEVLATVEREKVTVVLGVPTMLHELLNHPSFPDTDISTFILSDYSVSDGAITFVPRSHKLCRHALPGEISDRDMAVPVVAPPGSLVVFHGNTWHGALPRRRPGYRFTRICYFARM